MVHDTVVTLFRPRVLVQSWFKALPFLAPMKLESVVLETFFAIIRNTLDKPLLLALTLDGL